MNYLFERVHLGDKPLLWGGYKSRSSEDFAGFYHWHQCCEILLIHEGKGSIIVNQKAYELRRGLLFFFQPFQLHKIHVHVSHETPYVRTVIHLDPYLIEQLLRPFPARHALFSQLWKGHTREQAIDVTPAADYLEQAFDLYDQACLHGGGDADEEMMMLVLQIMHGISFVKEHVFRTETADGRTRPLNYAETMMQWIEEHYSEDIQLEDIANALHLSKFYVSRLFQDETGGTINQYLTARRIKQACRLLQTTALPVEQIGVEVGIPNASYFIRLFKRVVGTTPLKYRRK